MAELISRYFDVLIAEMNALGIPQAVKEDIIDKLNFLKLQSLCDYDRRLPTQDLREVWKNVDRAMSQHGLYDRYTPSKKVWDTIGMFVEVGQFRPTPSKRVREAPLPSPYLDMDVTRLLEAIGANCSGITFIKIRIPLKDGLKFLEEESKKSPHLRNQTGIIETWKRIHPELKKRAILRPFEADPMKTRLMDFLKGTANAPSVRESSAGASDANFN